MWAALGGLKFSRLELEAIGALLILAAALIWLGVHDASVKRAATAPILAEIHAAQADAAASAAVDAARVAAEQKGNLREAQNQNLARAADVRDLADAVAVARRMRDDAIRPSPAASDPGSSGAGASGSDTRAGMVSWELYASALGARAEAESDAADLAGYLGGLRASGELCARDYDALQPVKP